MQQMALEALEGVNVDSPLKKGEYDTWGESQLRRVHYIYCQKEERSRLK